MTLLGFGAEGLGFRGLPGFRVEGLGFRGFWVEGLEVGVEG